MMLYVHSALQNINFIQGATQKTYLQKKQKETQQYITLQGNKTIPGRKMDSIFQAMSIWRHRSLVTSALGKIKHSESISPLYSHIGYSICCPVEGAKHNDDWLWQYHCLQYLYYALSEFDFSLQITIVSGGVTHILKGGANNNSSVCVWLLLSTSGHRSVTVGNPGMMIR